MPLRRWLFSPQVDVGVFAGSVLASVALVLVAPWLGIASETPLWAWVVLVVGIDVAHVWSTLFRVYLDGDELRRRPVLYAGAPLFAWALGVVAYGVSSGFFWRLFAYAAVWHFVKQQVGWMVLYGRRSGSSERQIRFDAAAIYAATLGPVVWWHANLPQPFWWFVDDDFIGGLPRWVGSIALGLQFAVLVAWLGAQGLRKFRGQPVHPGKVILLAATWVAWFGGIVLAKSDFAFTAMNVVLHGVPYFALLYRYSRGRQAEGGYGKLGWLLRAGLPGFFTFLISLAFLEELFWDRLVWHDRPSLFGGISIDLPEGLLALVVPLLAVPQATHYLLDGFIWRSRSDPNLAARLGWAEARPALPPEQPGEGFDPAYKQAVK